jgi:uncharacterized protein
MTLMLNRSMLRVGLVLVLAGWLAACGAEPKPATYKQEILQHRMQRDMNLRDKNSVLAPSLRDAFKGLHYFPVDSSYRFQVSLERAASPDTVRMRESTGGMVAQAKIGAVELTFPDGRSTTLSVFRLSGQEDLWIPFKDSTNRSTTYPAGRYLDAEIVDDSLLVDFNKAYNPACDYNPQYACPFPPPENRIAFAVPAGEQRSNLHAY